MKHVLLVNFGGPRHLNEVPVFLQTLLRDRELIRTWFPTVIHNWIFDRVARKRAPKTQKDYALIGGRSPIYFDTEIIAQHLAQTLGCTVTTFHRYLPSTHGISLNQIANSSSEEILVLPLFPQFCYATTGSIARFFSDHLSVSQL